MAENSLISWTRFTWNPYQGCKKISPGCDFCYMYRDKIKYGQQPDQIVRSKLATFDKPLHWHSKLPAHAPLHDRLVFTSSWTDFFISQGDAWRAEAWQIIRQTPNLVYQILTKRPHRIEKCLPADWGEGYPNVWLGVTVENQAMAEQRIPILSRIPARIRFLSLEPLLERVELYDLLGGRPASPSIGMRPGFKFDSPIHWMIVGGESGNEQGDYRYRPCALNWIENVIETGLLCDVPVWTKQTGTYLSKLMRLSRHGTEVSEWPEWMRVQQLPRFTLCE